MVLVKGQKAVWENIIKKTGRVRKLSQFYAQKWDYIAWSSSALIIIIVSENAVVNDNPGI